MNLYLTKKDVSTIQVALNCLEEHPEYMERFVSAEELWTWINPLDSKLEKVYMDAGEDEQIQIVI